MKAFLEYRQSLPTEEDLKMIANGRHLLLIIDNMQMKALDDVFIANIFSREMRYHNISAILILQNLFHQGKYCRDICLNTHYLILF